MVYGNVHWTFTLLFFYYLLSVIGHAVFFPVTLIIPQTRFD